jgi:molybdopterin-guanine dinucleotide biosynthesis protein A
MIQKVRDNLFQTLIKNGKRIKALGEESSLLKVKASDEFKKFRNIMSPMIKQQEIF